MTEQEIATSRCALLAMTGAWEAQSPVADVKCNNWEICSDGFRTFRTAAVVQLMKQ